MKLRANEIVSYFAYVNNSLYIFPNQQADQPPEYLYIYLTLSSLFLAASSSLLLLILSTQCHFIPCRPQCISSCLYSSSHVFLLFPFLHESIKVNKCQPIWLYAS